MLHRQALIGAEMRLSNARSMRHATSGLTSPRIGWLFPNLEQICRLSRCDNSVRRRGPTDTLSALLTRMTFRASHFAMQQLL
jgi:hypothetical protein